MASILIAEDNRVTAEIMRVRLESAGHEVVWAADGREALEQLDQSRPNLILLDMMMPEIDGAEILRRIKADAVLGSIPVLVVSARSHEEDILGALAAGADDYLTKPVSLRELVARVDRALAKGPQPVRITVRPPDGPVDVGEVLEADTSRASVRFHRDSAARYPIGSRVELSLSSPSLPETIAMTAQVQSRAEADPYRVYEFGWDRRGERSKRMATAFLNVVGGRSQYRLPLFDADPPLEATVLTQSGGASHELTGVLQDLSAGGARVLLKGDAEQVLHRVDGFELRLHLPDSDEPPTLTADVRHRSASGDGVCYRLRFDPEASPDFLEQQERISAFVISRMAT